MASSHHRSKNDLASFLFFAQDLLFFFFKFTAAAAASVSSAFTAAATTYDFATVSDVNVDNAVLNKKKEKNLKIWLMDAYCWARIQLKVKLGVL